MECAAHSGLGQQGRPRDDGLHRAPDELSSASPEQAYRACLGVLRLAREVGRTRLEAACARALAINARTYKSVASILKHGLDRPAEPPAQSTLPFDHANVRGSHYYH